MHLTIDLEKHFIQMPPVTRPRTSASQAVGVSLTKLATPTPNSLISESEAAHGHHLLNVAITNGEAAVKPHAMTNDL